MNNKKDYNHFISWFTSNFEESKSLPKLKIEEVKLPTATKRHYDDPELRDALESV
jgi:hypothetical protein